MDLKEVADSIVAGLPRPTRGASYYIQNYVNIAFVYLEIDRDALPIEARAVLAKGNPDMMLMFVRDDGSLKLRVGQEDDSIFSPSHFSYIDLMNPGSMDTIQEAAAELQRHVAAIFNA